MLSCGFINFSEGSFPQCLFLLFDPWLHFSFFCKDSSWSRSQQCQASSGNRFLKHVYLCYLCTGTLLKEPLDWKHSTGKRNVSSHPTPASSPLLWGSAVGKKSLSLAERTTNSRVEQGCSGTRSSSHNSSSHHGTKHQTTAFLV